MQAPRAVDPGAQVGVGLRGAVGVDRAQRGRLVLGRGVRLSEDLGRGRLDEAHGCPGPLLDAPRGLHEPDGPDSVDPRRAPRPLPRQRHRRHPREVVDVLRGDVGDDRVDDTLHGMLDDDTLVGGDGRDMLVGHYGVDPHRIAIIPHGTPDRPRISPTEGRVRLALDERPTILTFGLLAPGKGIEVMIEAMPAIVARVPGARYIVLGATHPALLRREGLYSSHIIEWRKAADAGARSGTTSKESAEIKRLKAENKQLREDVAILKAATTFFAGELDPRNR